MGICPKCYNNLNLINTVTTLSELADSGYIRKNLGKKIVTMVACPKCGYTHQVKITIDGLKNIEEEEKIKLEVPNTIGRRE